MIAILQKQHDSRETLLCKIKVLVYVLIRVYDFYKVTTKDKQ